MKKNQHRKTYGVKEARFAKSGSFVGADNVDDLLSVLSNYKIFSEVLGFAPENLLPLYENALGMLQANRTEDAVAAFSFLTKINPYLPEFWIGLGLSYKADGNSSLAFIAFLMALSMDPLLIDAYELAIDCCIEKEDYKQAEALVKQIIYSLKHCHSSHESKQIQYRIKKLEEKIALKRSY